MLKIHFHIKRISTADDYDPHKFLEFDREYFTGNAFKECSTITLPIDID